MFLMEISSISLSASNTIFSEDLSLAGLLKICMMRVMSIGQMVLNTSLRVARLSRRISTRMEKRISVRRAYERDERRVRVDVFDDFLDLVQQAFDLVFGHEGFGFSREDDEADSRERLDPGFVLVVFAAPVRRKDDFVEVHREDVLFGLRDGVADDVHPVVERLLGADEEVVVFKQV